MSATASQSELPQTGLAWFTLAVSTCVLLLLCVWALLNQDKLFKPGKSQMATQQVTALEVPLADSTAKLAAKKQQADTLAAQKAAQDAADKLAAQKAAQKAAQEEAGRLAAQKAAQDEADRLAAQKAAQDEADRLAAQKAAQDEAEKLAAQVEADRLAAAKAAQVAADKLAAEKLADRKAEEERLAIEQAAAEQAEVERLATEQAARLANEKAEADRLAAAQAEAEQVAAELAAQNIEDEKRAAESAAELAAKQVEEERLAAETRQAEQLLATPKRAIPTVEQLASLSAAVAEQETPFERSRREELAGLPELSAQLRFESNGIEPRPASKATLDRLFELLFLYSETVVTVQVSSNEYEIDDNNQLISRERALTLINYLIDRGLDEERFRIRALGKQRLPDDSHRVTVVATVIDK